MPFDSGLSTRGDRASSPVLDAGILPAAGPPAYARVHRRPLPVPAIVEGIKDSLTWPQLSSAYFDLRFDPASFEQREVEALLQQIDEDMLAISQFIGVPIEQRFVIYLLDEHLAHPPVPSTHSHVDSETGAIILIRAQKRSLYSNILVPLTHALCAMQQRRHTQSPGSALLSDAFSTVVNTRLSTHSEVFPFFGVEPDVVCYELYTRKAVRSLTECIAEPESCTLLERHVVVGAFLLFLGDQYGDPRLLELCHSSSSLRSTTFTRLYGATLAELERVWVDHLPASLVALTAEEREGAILHWDTMIGNYC